ncbi:hypothetical protein OHT93_14180 [Streptomyces sp. NBC_00191]|uniref:hypothetical protein n=1 Tax=Streptomyces sp. NBC_00191 TaxID=2975674 RepID=UPI003253412B
MARRAEEAQVFQPVVEPIAVDVVDLQDELLPLPYVAHPASVADVRDTEIIECAPQMRCLGAGGARLQPYKDFGCAPAVLGRDAAVVALAHEVVGRNIVSAQTALHASATGSVVGDAQLLEHARDAPRGGYSGRELVTWQDSRPASAPAEEVRGVDAELIELFPNVPVRAVARGEAHVLDHLADAVRTGGGIREEVL